ncbi:hypothetical protein Pla52n_08550 [Stieleria varia]|uniref:Uncharacterized protein n=1 Tax=Stieleria varia TaxID=2528005 RepID=A0A5C6B866_9BACT|nr:hypothetical protein Pla52n_08550 [Stieleria varia]
MTWVSNAVSCSWLVRLLVMRSLLATRNGLVLAVELTVWCQFHRDASASTIDEPDRFVFENRWVRDDEIDDSNSMSRWSRGCFGPLHSFAHQFDRLLDQAQPMSIRLNQSRSHAIDESVLAWHRYPLSDHRSQCPSPMGNNLSRCGLRLLPCHHPVRDRQQRDRQRSFQLAGRVDQAVALLAAIVVRFLGC